jgi:photosystem II stability/assembly factor-like uncharacterized protein
MTTKTAFGVTLGTLLLALVPSGCSWRSFGVEIHAVRYASERVGWAVGDEGLVMRTTDGGKTWSRQSSGVTAALRALAVTRTADGSYAGVAAGEAGALVRTLDGTTWRRADVSLSETLRSAATSADARLVLVAGDGGTLLRSEDRGASWTSIAVGPANVTSVTLDGRGSVAIATDDSGATWESRDRALHFECVVGAEGALARNFAP